MNQTLINNITVYFTKKYTVKPLLVFSPGRINLIGGHTDYNQGYVLPAAIDKGIVAAIQKSDASISSVTALDFNEQLDFSLEKMQSVANGSWKNYVIGVVAEIQKKGKRIGNFNLVFGGDIPTGAGISSSAALENSIVYSINELFQLGLSKKEMIYISQAAEHNYVGVKCGIMDQYASMFGEENSVILLDCQSLKATITPVNFDDYEILLINSNVKHSLVESEYNKRRKVCDTIASLLNVKSLRNVSEHDLYSIKDQIIESDYQKALYVIQESKRVLQAFDAIKNNSVELLGELLHYSHKGLQHQYKVSCEELDFLVAATVGNNNIAGSRMMGGGFGGCTINIIKKKAISEFSDVIKKAFINKFKINCSIYKISFSKGTQVIKA